jgi:SAM-dependent methyltransferase
MAAMSLRGRQTAIPFKRLPPGDRRAIEDHPCFRALRSESLPTSLRIRGHQRTQISLIAEVATLIRRFANDGHRLLEVDAGRGLQTLLFRDQLSAPETAWICDRKDRRAREVASETEFARVGLDEQALPVPDDFFDVVVWDGELVTLKDVVRPLTELQRVLRPGGIFLLSVPNLAALHNRILLATGHQPTTLHIADDDHIRGFAIRSMTSFLRRSGWGVGLVDGIGLHPFTSGVIGWPLRDFSHTALWLLRNPSRQRRGPPADA